jgi:hypothetical protein
MSASNFKLPIPTNRTVTGPKFRNDGNQVVVEYDCERDDGTLEWSQIVFNEVAAFEYRDGTCCREADVFNFREVRVLEESQYLSDVLTRWQTTVGWQEWQQKQGGAARLKHFTVFFDDDGCINVVAAALSCPHCTPPNE